MSEEAAAYSVTAFLSFLPVSELRGAIPFAVANGLPWYTAFITAVFFNALAAPVCMVFLSTLNRLFLKISRYERFFKKFIERARNKLSGKVERWGWLGITLFVAIPLPLTGAWTGTLGAWVLGLSRRKTMFAVFLGVLTAGVIVTTVVLLGKTTFGVFVKNI